MFSRFITLTLSCAQFFSSSFSNIKQNTKLPRGKQRIWMLRRVQTSLPLLNQVCSQIVLLIQKLTNCVALSSTDSWMEKMIRKKQDNVRKPNVVPSELAAVQVDPLDELQRYLRQPRLKRGDCPNPIAWWGVSDDFPFINISLTIFRSINQSTRSSVLWLGIIWPSLRRVVLQNAHFHYPHVLMTLDADK